jgi:hypothetical protein
MYVHLHTTEGSYGTKLPVLNQGVTDLHGKEEPARGPPMQGSRSRLA